MRGLRLPCPGYALPALSPDKKQIERKKQSGLCGHGISLFARKVHNAESCCNHPVLSILENSVTCDTKSDFRGRNTGLKIPVKTYVALGLVI
jgi:hypothetical protein